MRIYTRTGDGGETGLYGGQRVTKDHPRVCAYGDVDELNAFLGFCLAEGLPPAMEPLLLRLQAELFTLGADLATPDDAPAGAAAKAPRVNEGMAAALEPEIDRWEADLPPLRQFILPGGDAAAARLHVARAVCRRAERSVVTLIGLEDVNPEIVVYLNRLSDLLFVLARAANRLASVEETPWSPPES